MIQAIYDAPFLGRLLLSEEDGLLRSIRFSSGDLGEVTLGPSPTLTLTVQALDAFFAGTPIPEELTLAPEGTPFQREVWAVLRTIPRGETRTYGEIARLIGRPNALRAVGQACHRNPIPLLIPCHRVVGAAGLTGYAGGLERKRTLLAMEGILSPKLLQK